MQAGRNGAGQEVGGNSSVGQVELILLLKKDGIIYECVLLDEASRTHFISVSHLRLQCDTGKLIAHKHKNRWYVERNLSLAISC